MSRPVALTIAGSDSSGGAGIQADLKTFAALGVYGASVLTALTAQNTRGVFAIHVVPPEFVVAQIEAVADDLSVGAVKTGMLADRACVEAVAAAVERLGRAPLVVDPVMVATSGAALIEPDAVAAVVARLLPLADLVTPNLAEAAVLTSGQTASSGDEMITQARALVELGAKAALVKGGHGEGREAIDVLASSEGVFTLTAPRVDTRHTHGTGCTLSAAIAAELAKGASLLDAVTTAKDFVWHALTAAREDAVGHGNGPVDHGIAAWPRVAVVHRC